MSFTTSQRPKKRKNFTNSQTERERATNKKKRAIFLLTRIQVGDTQLVKREKVGIRLKEEETPQLELEKEEEENLKGAKTGKCQ